MIAILSGLFGPIIVGAVSVTPIPGVDEREEEKERPCIRGGIVVEGEGGRGRRREGRYMVR